MMHHGRRSFLFKCARLAAIVAAGNSLADISMAIQSSKKPQEDSWLALGRLSDLPDNGNHRLETATRIGDSKKIQNPKLIVFRKGDEAHVMSTKCTHRGCEVNLQQDGSYLCPCHKSRYEKSGRVTKGPAKKPLPWYEVRIAEGGEVQVNVGKTIEPPYNP
jgi:Rieske Fe-S protein